MKPRYTPALTKYGANTSKGLCVHCGEAVDIHSRWLTIAGIQHRIHHACWKAILVAERLNPSPEVEMTSVRSGVMWYNSPSYTERDTERDIIERFLTRQAL